MSPSRSRGETAPAAQQLRMTCWTPGKDTASPVLIDTIRQGIIKKGSFLAFVSADSNSSVTVNGVRTPLPAGSLVKIRADSDTSGTVTLRHGNIMSCSFADATLFMNGNQAAKGSFGDCLVPAVRNYHANLTFAIVPTLGEVRQILINGSKIRAGPENSYIVVTQDTTDAGNDLTLVNLPGYFEGSANQFLNLARVDCRVCHLIPSSGKRTA